MKTIRVALYARVSTDMQVEGGLSIPAQLSEMKEFMAKRPGWTVAAEFVDPGLSGSTMRRPALQAMLQAVEQGKVDIVLVHELSRLSRSIFDSFRIFEDLGRKNVGFASVNDPDFDFSSPQGRFFLTMISAMNQYYLDLLKQHTAKGKRERARQGLYNASITPYGYEHVGDAKTPPAIVETEAAAVRELKEETGYTPDSIRFLAPIYPSVGYCTERIDIFYAEVNEPGETDFDPDENIETVLVTEKEMDSMIRAGQVQDAKTLAAWALYKVGE